MAVAWFLGVDAPGWYCPSHASWMYPAPLPARLIPTPSNPTTMTAGPTYTPRHTKGGWGEDGECGVCVGFVWGECMGRERGEEGMGTYVALLVWCGV